MDTTLARVTERLIRAFRSRGSRMLDSVQIRLLRRADGHSGDRTRWIAEMREAAEDGSLAKRIESQRAPEEIVEQWARSAST
jgi:hypothetical protein